jgi:cytochrome c-type biogenesis protein CcmH/NrfG
MTMEQMKAMADRRAAPLLEKLQANPTDAAALSQLGALYSSAHQFPQSAEYYRKALECFPRIWALARNWPPVSITPEMWMKLSKHLQQVLKTDPKNANPLQSGDDEVEG